MEERSEHGSSFARDCCVYYQEWKGIRFWKDRWVNRGCLKDLFPVIFKAVKFKDATIAEVLGSSGWNCIFKKQLNANEQLEWDLLRRDLAVLPRLVEEDDEMKLMDNFSVHNCYELLARDSDVCNIEVHLWKTNIPHKVSFILWASFHNSLPTRDVLGPRGVDIDSDCCVLCNAERETTDHMFIHCPFSFKVWDYFIKAFKIVWPLPGSLLQLFDAWRENVLRGRGREVWKIVHYAICWIIWTDRNDRVFGARRKRVTEVIDNIKYLVVLWSWDADTFKFINLSLIWSNWDLLMST